MAVTRIKNNQITDSTITYAKIASGTLVGSNFNPNLTLNSNVQIVGNLTVTGTSSTVSSTNTYVNDPLIVFNNGYVGSLTGYDIGVLVNRNLASLAGYGSVNTAWVWSEADAAFVALVTTDTGGGITSLNNSGFANVKVGNLTANSLTITTGTLTAGSIIGQFSGNAAFATLASTNFSTGNAQITGGSITGTNAALTTLVATNFSSGNAIISGGNAQGLGYISTTNFATGNAVISGGNAQGLGYLSTTNFATGNAVISGGSITGTNAALTTLVATNFSSGNVVISGGNAQGLGYLSTTNFATGNAIISGGNAQGMGYISATNFATGNAVITGGSLNNTPIGATTASTANVTTLNTTGVTTHSGNVVISSGADTVSTTTGALLITGTGGASIGGNAYVGNNLYIGPTALAQQANFANPTIIAVDSGTNYAQIALKNTNANGSADFAAYADNGTDAGGWVDVGVAGSTYSDSNYTITKPQDGSLMVRPSSNSYGGNLVIATSEAGSYNDVIIGVGSFAAASEVARFHGNATTSGYFALKQGTAATNTTSGALQVTGGAGISGNLYVGNLSVTGTTTAANFVGTHTGTAAITGGSITGTNAALTTLVATNFATGNAQITGGTISGATIPSIGTVLITNLSTGNAQITGGSITGTNAALTTLVATNFSSGNAIISGGNAQGLGYVSTTNFATGNAQITGGSLTGITGAVVTTLLATNISSGNIVGVLNGTATTGNVALYENYTATSTAADYYPSFTDRSTTGNSAAYINSNFKINPSTGVLTSQAHSVTASTQSTSASSGALIVTGGAGIGANLYVGGNLVVSGNLTVQGTVTAIQSTTLDVSDLNITVAKGAATAAAANGAGITVDGASATLLYTSATDSWNFNKQVIGQFTTSNLQSTGGAITGMTGAFSTLQATNFSSGNAIISGGNAQGLGYISTTNFATGNAVITGGSVTGITGTATTFLATNFSTSNAQITGGSITGTNAALTTLVATNFSSGNVVISGGNAQGLGYVSTTNFATGNAVIAGGNAQGMGYISTTNFATGNAQITGGTISGTSIPSIGTVLIANLSTANAQITGGSVTGITGAATTFTATNFSSGNIVGILNGTATTANVSYYDNITATTTNATYYPLFTDRSTTGNASNFMTPGITFNPSTNAVTATTFTGTFSGTASITSGSITGTNAALTTLVATNFSSGNVVISGGNAQGLGYVSTTNFATGNAQITGGSVTGITGAATTFTATNFSSGNAIITGGSLNAAAVGATTASSGKFTTLEATSVLKSGGNLLVTSDTKLSNATDAAFIITGNGGAAIGGNVLIGGTINVGANSLLTPLVNSSISAVNSGSTYAQIALLNTIGSGSADLVAYGNNGSDAGGWADVGMTGNAFSDSNYTITKSNDGYFIVRPKDSSFGGNLVLATSEAGSYNDIVIGVGSFLSTAEVARFHGNVSTSGYLNLQYTTAATSTTTGALRVAGGTGIAGALYNGGVHISTGNIVAASTTESTSTTTGSFITSGGVGIAGNVYAGKAATFNTGKVAGNDFTVKGKADDTLIWAHAGTSYDTVIIGNSAVAANLVTGAKLLINSTDSIILPVGTTAQRPSAIAGGSDVTGMLRYSTTTGAIEWYTGTIWQSASSNFTVIADQQFTGTGSQVDFTLSEAQTTNSCIVSINGVIQIPTLAYSVVNSGLTLRFTEAPADSDVIDVRKLTTTATVTQITSQNGYDSFAADNTAGLQFYTGAAAPTLQYTLDTSGAWVTQRANTAVASANTPTAVDSFAVATYRSAKYVIQATSSGKYQTMEALVIHDDTTPTITTYGIVQTNGNVGVLTASIAGGTLSVNFVGANANTNVRVRKEYMII